MKRLFGDGDVTPFLSLQLAMERAIRAQCSEHVILQVHDAVYAPVKRATAQVHDAIEVAMGDALGVNPFYSLERSRTSIAALRRLLDPAGRNATSGFPGWSIKPREPPQFRGVDAPALLRHRAAVLEETSPPTSEERYFDDRKTQSEGAAISNVIRGMCYPGLQSFLS